MCKMGTHVLCYMCMKVHVPKRVHREDREGSLAFSSVIFYPVSLRQNLPFCWTYCFVKYWDFV